MSQLKGDSRPPIEIIEHKDKQKQLKNETRYFEQGNPFKKDINETQLVKYLLEIVTRANDLLDMSSAEK